MRHPFPRSCSRLAGVAGFALAWLLTSTTHGQETLGDQASLARYVPKDNLILYLEYEGLNAHADAWKKTAAYKILNNTPTGVMLEEVVAQVLDKFSDQLGKGRKAGSELVILIKHVAHNGFVFASVANPQDPAKSPGILVLRNAFKDKAVRAIMARNLQEMNAPNTRPQKVVRAEHNIVSGVNTRGSGFAWWIEESKKEDLVQVFPSAEAADIFLETLDGKKPNAISHPRRVELAKAENGFLPNGWAFFGTDLLKKGPGWKDSAFSNIKDLDIRWGFQDDALMTSTRITTSGPRTGWLSLLDGPTFDKGKLPSVPESVTGFTVVSLDLKSTMNKLVGLAKTYKPDAEDQVKQILDLIKTKTKLRLKEDILAHLGPKIAWYILPAKASATGSVPGANMISMIMAGAGMDQIPKLAVVFDIDDSVAFGKVLDEVMAATNREFKAQASQGLGEAPQPRTGRNRGPSGPSFEFRMMSGETKMYVLQIPPELAGQFPASLRPSIRVGPKQVVLAVSPDIARLVLESKANWAPPSELTSAFQGLSPRLRMLDVSDPRETLPGLLGSLPAKLQSSINTAVLLKSGGAPPPGVAPSGGPMIPSPGGPVAGGSAPGAEGQQRARDSAGPGINRPGAMAIGGSGGSGSGGGPGFPGIPGAPGGAGAPGAASPAGGATPFVLKIDADKVPSADSIKALLFPSIFTVEVNDDEIRITTRESFPALPDPSKLSAISTLAPALMGKGGLPLGVAPLGGSTTPGAASNPGGSPTPGTVPSGPGSATEKPGRRGPGPG